MAAGSVARVTAPLDAVDWPVRMERLGMRRESQAVRDSLHRSGGWLDGFGFASSTS